MSFSSLGQAPIAIGGATRLTQSHEFDSCSYEDNAFMHKSTGGENHLCEKLLFQHLTGQSGRKASTKGLLPGHTNWPGVPKLWLPLLCAEKGHHIMTEDGEVPKRCTAAPHNSKTQGEVLLVNGMDHLHKLPVQHMKLPHSYPALTRLWAEN